MAVTCFLKHAYNFFLTFLSKLHRDDFLVYEVNEYRRLLVCINLWYTRVEEGNYLLVKQCVEPTLIRGYHPVLIHTLALMSPELYHHFWLSEVFSISPHHSYEELGHIPEVKDVEWFHWSWKQWLRDRIKHIYTGHYAGFDQGLDGVVELKFDPKSGYDHHQEWP